MDRSGWRQLIARLIDMQGDSNRSNGAKQQDRAARARIRRGIAKETEAFAYADVLPYATLDYNDQIIPMAEERKTRLLRAAAILATHENLRHDEKASLGACFARISRGFAEGGKPYEVNPIKPDAVASRLSMLPRLDVNAASEMINRILQLGRDMPLQLNFYGFVQTILNWNTGVQTVADNSGNRILREYYGSLTFTPTDNESVDDPADAANE